MVCDGGGVAINIVGFPEKPKGERRKRPVQSNLSPSFSLFLRSSSGEKV